MPSTPTIVASSDLTNQSSPSTTIAYTTASNGAGFYRVSWNIESTSTSDVLNAQATWTDSTGAKSGGNDEAFPISNVSSQPLYSIASSPIKVVLGLTSTTNFNLHIRVEKL